MKRLTLQWRITLLTAFILTISSISLTVIAMANAEATFVSLFEESTYVSPVDALPTEGIFGEASTAGEASTPAQIAKRGFDFRSILSCVISTVLGSIAAYYVAGKALSPLRELSTAVRSIDENTLSQRLADAPAHDEVGTLTEGFNQMLVRLDDAFLRQKRFTANAAHELKTPLATMKTGIQVLSADQAVTMDDYKDYTQKTLSSIDRLSMIVDDLLLLASAGEKTENEKEEVWLEPLFDAILSELSPQLEQREVTCTVDCGDILIQGNAPFLYRSFFNLIENACKYGRKGGHIWITARQEEQAIWVSVKDDGPGIKPEHLPYIFDAFYRVDKSRSREMGGSGLGLSLVKTMIETEGGHISVDSDGINGTCFTVGFSI